MIVSPPPLAFSEPTSPFYGPLVTFSPRPVTALRPGPASSLLSLSPASAGSLFATHPRHFLSFLFPKSSTLFSPDPQKQLFCRSSSSLPSGLPLGGRRRLVPRHAGLFVKRGSFRAGRGFADKMRDLAPDTRLTPLPPPPLDAFPFGGDPPRLLRPGSGFQSLPSSAPCFPRGTSRERYTFTISPVY